MKVSILPEPPLEFALMQRHDDIRFGLMEYGALDRRSKTAPTTLRLGIVGTRQTVDTFLKWIEKCKNVIPEKESHLQALFPQFPGFNQDHTFYSHIVTESSIQRQISTRDIELLIKLDSNETFVTRTAHRFVQEIKDITTQGRVDVVVCAMPEELRTRRAELRNQVFRTGTPNLDLHDLIKALALALGIPLQFIWQATFDPQAKRSRATRAGGQSLQDEATRAWNLHSALYYKAGGIPYRLPREASDLDACFIGITFFKNLDGSELQTSMAQVFNQRGEGVIVLGGRADYDKSDRQVHLNEANSYHLLYNALDTYRREHHNLPARVVLHKTSEFNEAEQAGFDAALGEQRVSSGDYVSLRSDTLRLFRHGDNPPLRGTYWTLDDRIQVLYTRGSVPFYRTYPGMYVPRTLRISCDRIDQTPEFLAREILALSKLNYNDTQLDGSAPMTIRAAKHVASIVKCLPQHQSVPASFRFYM